MSIDEFSEGDIIYRINSHCLVGGISDKDFRNNAQSLLEDIRGYFMGRYEVMAEFRPPQMDGCIACHDELNARIAELTAEVARLEDELRNEQHALRLADRATLDLADECARYEAALERISRMAPETIPEPTAEQLERNFVYIARNALKDISND